MVEISLSGSGESPGWATAPGYSTAAFPVPGSAIPTNRGIGQPHPKDQTPKGPGSDARRPKGEEINRLLAVGYQEQAFPVASPVIAAPSMSAGESRFRSE